MDTPDNPAGRLYTLLKEAKVPPSQGDRQKVRIRWAEVLGLDPNDRPALLAQLSRIFTLPEQIRTGLQSVPDLNPERYLEPLDNVERAFSNLNLENQWNSFASPIDAATMAILGVCDERLSATRPEPVVPEDERKDLHEAVRALFEDVKYNEEDPDLREFLLRHLAAMDRALNEYRISGTPPLEDAVAAAVGDAILRQQRGKEADGKKRSRRFWQVIRRAVLLLSLLDMGTGLGTGLLAALPMGDDPPDLDEETEGKRETDNDS